MERSRLGWVVSLAFVLLAAGCSGKDRPDRDRDTGTDEEMEDAGLDAEVPSDAEVGLDADAALDTDAASNADAAGGDDGAAGGADAGTDLDGTVGGDAELDASTGSDASNGGDGGTGGTLDGGDSDGAATNDTGTGGGGGDGDGAVADGSTGTDGGGSDGGAQACPGDNGGITLPPGFCATRFAENVIGARHLTVTPAGDVYVATASRTAATPSFVALRDTNGDGTAEVREAVGSLPGNGIAWENGYLYFAANDRVLRYTLPNGQLTPTAEPEVVIRDLPATGDHVLKTVVVVGDTLFLNIGSASNSCQEQNRQLHSPGIDPCPELATRAGVWRFAADALNQTLADGTSYGSGLRNANALAYRRGLGKLFAAQNSRDQLHENWPELFSEADDVRLPAEGIFFLHQGWDYGWPYCYFDREADHYFLAPEYGGDGETTGARCENLPQPTSTLPAHWAPLGAAFYENDVFPAHYRGGLFIANHGSRFAPNATEPLPGYNVVFIPFSNELASGPYERFAEGFAGSGRPLPENAAHRPVGITLSSDGSLYLSDDKGGVIWRIYYQGT
jgi:glucose/arabinose dehydrogenase